MFTIAAAFVAAATLAAGVASPNDLETALLRPLSPGAIALLQEHSVDPRVRERIGSALKSEDAATRAAAARVIYVRGLAAHAPALVQALAVEPDLDAGSDDAVLGAIRRLGPTTAAPLGLLLAWARGGAALQHLDALKTAGLQPTAVRSFLAAMARRDPAALNVAGTRALRDRDGDLWQALLGVARERGVPISPGILVVALGTDGPLVGPTVEHLALGSDPRAPRPQGTDPKAPLPHPVTEAIASLKAAGSPPRTYAWELLARRGGMRPQEQAARLGDEGYAPQHLLRAAHAAPSVRALMTDAERKVIRERLKLPDARERAESSAAASPANDVYAIELARGYPRGFVPSLLGVIGCEVDGSHILSGVFRRDPLGRALVDQVGQELAGSPQCASAALALATAHLDEPDDEAPTQETRIVLLPLVAEVIACGESPLDEILEPESTPASERRVGDDRSRITEPKKTHQVNPVYPNAALEKRIKGVVVLEAVISKTGCVSSLKLLKGVHLSLDAAAFRAVAAWRYTPTLLDGKPVPVIMNVTVNFRLN